MRHIILFSIAAVVLAGVAAWVVISIQSQRTPTVSQFDPFSPEEKAKNLPTQEWLDRNMWPEPDRGVRDSHVLDVGISLGLR